MEEKTIEIVSTPGLDTSGFFGGIIDFFISHSPEIWSGALSGGRVIIGYLVGLSIVVSVMLLIGIIVCVERLKYIRRKEDLELYPSIEVGYETVVKADHQLSKKWVKVATLIESDNESDWRQAILEADIMLGEILTKLGYQGEGIGEQLRRAVKNDFKTLDQAWEAHKIRNLIAHEGSGHPLTKFEARRIINLYQVVFREFFDF